MEKNNKLLLSFIGMLALGLFAGWLIWGKGCLMCDDMAKKGMHRMGDGTMMQDMDPRMHMGMSMNDMMGAMTASLAGKKDAAFDEAFLEEMIPHHQGAIEMARMVLSSTKRPELITLANEIIEAQQREINQMRDWQKTWFGVQPE